MRILAIASLYPIRQEDFAGQFNHISFRALCRQGHELVVFRPQCHLPQLLSPGQWRRRRQGHVPARYRLEGVPVRCPRYWRVPGRWWRPYEGAWLRSVIAPAASRLHRRSPFDVVYGCELTPDGVAAILLSRDLRLPVMVSSIGSDAHSYPYRSYAALRRTQWVLRQADLVLIESPGAIEAIRALVPEPLPVRVFNRGIDLAPYRQQPDRDAIRRQYGLPPDRRLVVFVGSLQEAKGIRLLLSVFGRIQERFADVDLVLVGSGPLEPWLREQAAVRSLQHRVHLLGRRPFPEIPTLLGSCDIFCLPSFAEGLPKSVIEAMAAGLPVVATAVGGIPDVVRDRASGRIIPPRAQDALASALSELLAEPDKAKRMGQTGRRRAFERYDADKNATRLIELAREAITRARARAAPGEDATGRGCSA